MMPVTECMSRESGVGERTGQGQEKTQGSQIRTSSRYLKGPLAGISLFEHSKSFEARTVVPHSLTEITLPLSPHQPHQPTC